MLGVNKQKHHNGRNNCRKPGINHKSSLQILAAKLKETTKKGAFLALEVETQRAKTALQSYSISLNIEKRLYSKIKTNKAYIGKMFSSLSSSSSIPSWSSPKPL